MLKFILVACLLVQIAVAAPATQAEAEERAELERIQNESAQYSYGSNIEDNINDGAIQREETRDGTKTQAEAEERAELERIQNESAQYSYGSNIEDNINDGAIQREETRDGTKVKGMYSYRDGFVMRTVYYEADENGYRVVKEDTQEIGDGPQFDENGEATVEGSLIPKYSIRLDTSDNEKHYKDARTR